jgi:hypothetical protein
VQEDADGSKYDGLFADDRKEGKGKLVARGFQYDGQWHCDKVTYQIERKRMKFLRLTNCGVCCYYIITAIWKRNTIQFGWELVRRRVDQRQKRRKGNFHFP